MLKGFEKYFSADPLFFWLQDLLLVVDAVLLAWEESVERELLCGCELWLEDSSVKKTICSWLSINARRDSGSGGGFTSKTPSRI